MSADYRQVFQPIWDRLGFKPIRVFRDGPRFFVVGGDYRGKKAIFKADVEAGPRRLRKARWRMRREALFLEHAGIRHIPKFYKKGVRRKLFWLLEEWVSGEPQEMGESTFLIKDSFFTERNLEYLLEFLVELHRLGRGAIPQFEEQFPRYTLVNYMNLIWTDRGHLLGEALAEKVGAFLKSCHKLFNANQTVITHHELYGPHIFVVPPSHGKPRGKLSVIDWENVGWGGPAYDFATIWIRSFAHRDFQTEFLNRFRALQDDRETFDRLFQIEVVLQGIGNLRYFKYTKVREERQIADGISEFLLESIERAVS